MDSLEVTARSSLNAGADKLYIRTAIGQAFFINPFFFFCSAEFVSAGSSLIIIIHDDALATAIDLVGHDEGLAQADDAIRRIFADEEGT